MITKREGTYFSVGGMLKFIDIDLDKRHVDAFQEDLRKSKVLEVDECILPEFLKNLHLMILLAFWMRF